MPTVTQLEYLLAVSRKGHFGRAAVACGVSQPTLSSQVQKIEETLGFAIFDRSAKPIAPTPRGFAVLEQAQKVVDAYKSFEKVAKGPTGELSGQIRLSAIPTISPYVIPWFLSKFSNRYPDIQLILTEATTRDAVAAMRRREVDAALMATPLGEPGLEERPLFLDEFYVYAAAEEPILAQGEVSLDSLEPDRVWLLSEGHCFREQMVALCDTRLCSGPVTNVQFEAGGFETLRQLLDRGEGYTLIPETFAQTLPAVVRRERVRPFAVPAPAREVSLVHPKDCLELGLVEALLSCIRESIPRLFEKNPDRHRVVSPTPV